MADVEIVQVPILPGMREDVHRHAAVAPGTLRYAKNLRWGALGAAERRNGTTEISTTNGAETQFPLSSATFPVELLAETSDATFAGKDGVAYALRPADAGWRYAGRYSSAEPRTGRVDLSPTVDAHDVASVGTAAISSNGFKLFAYSYLTPFADMSVNYVIQDSAGNAVEARALTNSRRARAVAVGTDLFLIRQKYSSNEIDIFRSQNGGTLTFVAAAFVTLDAAADSWDVAAWTSTHWVFASLDSSSTTITVHRMSGFASAANATQSASVRATSRLTIFADTNHVWLGWNDNTVTNGNRITCWNWTGSAFSSTFTAATWVLWTAATQTGTPPLIGTGPSATQVRIVSAIHNEAGHATPDGYTWRAARITTAGTISADSTQYHAIPVSKPFGPGGQYVWADLLHRRSPSSVFEAPKVRALLRCRDYTSSVDFQYVIDLLGHKQSENHASFNPTFTGAADWWFSAPVTPTGTYFSVLPLETAGATTPLQYMSFREFAVNATLECRDSSPMAGALNVAGQPCSVLRHANVKDTPFAAVETDGWELGFHRAPVIRRLTSSNGAGALTPSASYSYIAVYCVVDTAGRVHRSPPSAPVIITLGASDDTVAVDIATCEMQRSLLNGFSVPGIELYRTEANQDVHYLVRDNLVDYTGVLENSVADLLADTAIVDNRILYTALQVPNDMAPACRYLRASETRLWAAGLWDPTLIQASKIIVPEEPPLWSDLDTFKVRIPKPCTGIGFQDGILVAFAATDVYAVTTDGGPGNDGLTSFADPRLVCPGVGCADNRSILETPIGIMFQSRRGFELLARGLGNVEPLPGIETQLETYSEVVSSTLHVDERGTSAHFVVRATNDTTQVLVFDLDRRAWSVDTYPVALAQIGTASDGRLLAASSNSSVSPPFLVEDAAVFADAGTFFQSRLLFHDLYPTGPFTQSAISRVYMRGQAEGTCIANISIGVDGATPRPVTWTFTGADTFELAYEMTPEATQPSGQCVQLDVYDTTSGDASYGFTWFGLALAVIPQGRLRLPADRCK